MDVRIEQTWKDALRQEWDKPYFEELVRFVKQRYGYGTVYPPAGRIFAAFDSCPVPDVKVVVLGQDPYHGPGQANGLCFSVNEGVDMPPSLQNIFKEIIAELGGEMPASGSLDYLARQGVLLLNATLTVDAHHAGSHQGHGWEEFTDAVVRYLNSCCENLVFMLWGSYAIRKGAIVDRNRHLVLTSAHPSPLSAYRGFFGNGHFARANQYLVEKGKEPVKWLEK